MMLKLCGAAPVVSVLLGGEAAAQHPAHRLLSAVDVLLQVLSLGQLPHELTLLLQQGELEGKVRQESVFSVTLTLSERIL